MKTKKQKLNYATIGVRLINTEKPTTKVFTYIVTLKHGLARGDYVAVTARGTPMLGIVVRIDKTPQFEDGSGTRYIGIIGRVQEMAQVKSVRYGRAEEDADNDNKLE